MKAVRVPIVAHEEVLKVKSALGIVRLSRADAARWLIDQGLHDDLKGGPLPRERETIRISEELNERLETVAQAMRSKSLIAAWAIENALRGLSS